MFHVEQAQFFVSRETSAECSTWNAELSVSSLNFGADQKRTVLRIWNLR
jgi:hypothetical protein